MKFSYAMGCLVAALGAAPTAFGQSPTYVINISVDGLGSSYLKSQMDLGNMPNFSRFFSEGASTLNARTDYNYTITLPNHTSMITGLGVNDLGAIKGHNWTSNVDPAPSDTLHANRGSYVKSVFDVAHDNGLRTAVYTGKTKFSIYETSYNSANGAADVTGVNNGRDKVDVYAYHDDSALLTNFFIAGMKANPYNYTFLHYADTDEQGHGSGWGGTNYNNAMKLVDNQLGKIFDMIANTPTLTGKTAIVLTADHGGTGTNHSDATLAIDYTIPFLVWGVGAGVDSGVELYSLNTTSRLDPLTGRPTYTAAGQPIRNGDSANLALDMLGLGPIQDSTINSLQDLAVSANSQNLALSAVPEPTSVGLVAAGSLLLLSRRRKKHLKVRAEAMR